MTPATVEGEAYPPGRYQRQFEWRKSIILICKYRGASPQVWLCVYKRIMYEIISSRHELRVPTITVANIPCL